MSWLSAMINSLIFGCKNIKTPLQMYTFLAICSGVEIYIL